MEALALRPQAILGVDHLETSRGYLFLRLGLGLAVPGARGLRPVTAALAVAGSNLNIKRKFIHNIDYNARYTVLEIAVP